MQRHVANQLEAGYRVEEIAEVQAEVARLKANYDLLLAGTRIEEKEEAAIAAAARRSR